MDHLPVPRNSAHEPPEIPYLCSEPYDDGPFLTYPTRKGWAPDLDCRRVWDHEDTTPPRGSVFLDRAPKTARSIAEATAFVQTWLYFGLLKAVLGQHVREEDFIREGAHGRRVITTSRLMMYAAGFTQVDTLSPSALHKRQREIDASLSKAKTVFSFICSSSSIQTSILLSIGILGEFLTLLRIATFPGTTSPVDQYWSTGDWDNLYTAISPRRDCLAAQMLADGWCPTDVEKLTRCTPSARYFASNMVGPRGGGLHAFCKRDRCVLLHAEGGSSYIVKHTIPDCDCTFFGADPEILYPILQNDSIPLIVPSQSSEEFTIIEGRSHTKYVAFSHVWSDGIGNPLWNSLPRCQLRRMAQSTRECYGTDPGPTPFWIDTICCPTQPLEARNLAIVSMKKVYKEADKVCVLDSYIIQQPFSRMSKLEIMLRIYFSGWRRRLWTLQEGVLARQLFFKFADGVVDFDLLSQEMMQNGDEILAAGEFRTFKWEIRGNVDHRDVGNPFETIEHLRPALVGRSTSKITDEPLCFGTLLGLDAARIVDGPVEERMKRFWSLLPRIPPGVIFYSGDHLPDPGYRWAPVSLLQALLPQDADSFEGPSTPAVLTESGLIVKLSGMILPTLAPISEFVWLRDRRARMLSWIQTQHDPDDHDYSACDITEIDPTHHMSYALVFCNSLDHIEQYPARYGGTCPALLVSVGKIEGGIIYAKSVRMGLLYLGQSETGVSGPRSPWQNLQRTVRELSKRTQTHWIRLKARLKKEDVGVSETDILMSGKQWLVKAEIVREGQRWCID